MENDSEMPKRYIEQRESRVKQIAEQMDRFMDRECSGASRSAGKSRNN